MQGMKVYIRYKLGLINTKMGFGEYLGDGKWKIGYRIVFNNDIIEWRTINEV